MAYFRVILAGIFSRNMENIGRPGGFGGSVDTCWFCLFRPGSTMCEASSCRLNVDLFRREAVTPPLQRSSRAWRSCNERCYE